MHLIKNVVTKRAEAASADNFTLGPVPAHIPARNSIRQIVPKLTNDAELATKHPEKFALILIQKLSKIIEANEDDSILSEHLDRVMKTPKSLKNLKKVDVDSKVGDWLASSAAAKAEAKSKTGMPSTSANSSRIRCEDVTIPVYAYGSNGILSETASTYEYIQYRDAVGQPISSDSGLSSIRIESESEVAESEMIELNGLKQRLIEETEGKIITTKLLYHFKNEKFIVRVPGRPPTLGSFKQKMHSKGNFRFFIRSEENAWVEITEDNEPIHVINNFAEAKVI